MSFVRTLATLAAGFAAAKGYDKYKDMGGMPGVKEAMRNNPQLNQMSDQAFDMMEKMGLPTDQLKSMRDQFLGQGEAAGASAMAGMGGLMAALGGGMAGGAEQTGALIDSLTGTTAATDAMEENAKLMEHLGEIDPAERAFIEAEMDKPVDAMALAQDTSQQMAAQVYAAALMTVKVDHLDEAEYLNTLASGLRLTDETRKRVHAAMGLA